MHSRVFELKTKESNNDYPHIPEWFYSIADYYGESENDRKSDICFFPHVLRKAIHNEKFKLTKKIKEEYFSEKFKDFQRELKSLQNLTFEDFSNYTGMLCGINRVYNDRYDIYILFDGYLHTLDDFLRIADENTYEIGMI